MGKLEIYEYNQGEEIPYAEITNILNKSYHEYEDAGLDYAAATQDIETTKKRMENAHCIVVKDADVIVGSLTYKIYIREEVQKRKWYEDNRIATIEQLAVLPEYRDSKAMLLMGIYMLRRLMKSPEHIESVIIDTSCEAKRLVRAYVGIGFQIVDLKSWETTNYYSYIFRGTLNGRKYSDRYCQLRFAISSFCVKMQYDKYGKKRI
ncbi:MAG: GNAT family N-acetyltransferase [Lachnospiraceae bacterium]|nr:GNAT family N-acetyltransferase [Lachnospiraceae bacterium]